MFFSEQTCNINSTDGFSPSPSAQCAALRLSGSPVCRRRWPSSLASSDTASPTAPPPAAGPNQTEYLGREGEGGRHEEGGLRGSVPSSSNRCLLWHCPVSTLTLCGGFVEAGDGDVGGVVAVASMRLREAVHVQQLPVGHLPVGVEHLLAFTDGPHAHHLQTVLRKVERRVNEREEEDKKSSFAA